MDWDPAPERLEVAQCGYVAPCGAKRCQKRGSLLLRLWERNGRPIRQIELCAPHAAVIIARERRRGLTIEEPAPANSARRAGEPVNTAAESCSAGDAVVFTEVPRPVTIAAEAREPRR